MDKIIGIIGCNDMGQAIIGGIYESEIVKVENIIVSDKNKNILKEINENYGVKITSDNIEVAKAADILILELKSGSYPIVIDEIKDYIKQNVIIVAVSTEKSLESIDQLLGNKCKLARVISNPPALIGQGMSAIFHNNIINDEELEEITEIFESIGKVEIVDENIVDVVNAISVSSPAYVYMFIEAMADAAVLGGMPRNVAYKFAGQAVIGAAKMVLNTGMHPAELKDIICYPGGTTIEAVAVLEEKGFRNAVIAAMKKCVQKNSELSK